MNWSANKVVHIMQSKNNFNPLWFYEANRQSNSIGLILHSTGDKPLPEMKDFNESTICSVNC